MTGAGSYAINGHRHDGMKLNQHFARLNVNSAKTRWVQSISARFLIRDVRLRPWWVGMGGGDRVNASEIGSMPSIYILGKSEHYW
jgi:hypothetical protein